MIDSVFKEWIFTLPYRMQSVLTSALRGCDTARKEDPSKFITRGIRGLLLNDADPSNTFITGNGIPEAKHVETFLWDMDCYPLHFIMHTAHAAEIIGYKHPNAKQRKWWLSFYKKIVIGLHLNFETEDQLDVRLGTTPAEKKVRKTAATKIEKETKTREEKIRKKAEKEAKHRWEAGTGTSHHPGRSSSYRSGNS